MIRAPQTLRGYENAPQKEVAGFRVETEASLDETPAWNSRATIGREILAERDPNVSVGKRRLGSADDTFKVEKRSRTTGQISAGSGADLLTHVQNTIVSRMSSRGLDISTLTSSNLKWILPSHDAVAQDWSALLYHPMLLSDEPLLRMLSL